MNPASKIVVRNVVQCLTRSTLHRQTCWLLLLQVIKIGTSSLLRPDLSSIKLSSLARICETVKELRNLGECQDE